MAIFVSPTLIILATNHSELSNLDYASSGHEGFAPSVSPVVTGQAQTPPITLSNVGGVVSWDLDDGAVARLSLGADVSEFVISNVRAGGFYQLIIEHADGVAHSISWPASIKWSGGVELVVSAVSGSVDVVSMMAVAANGDLFAVPAANFQ